MPTRRRRRRVLLVAFHSVDVLFLFFLQQLSFTRYLLQTSIEEAFSKIKHTLSFNAARGALSVGFFGGVRKSTCCVPKGLFRQQSKIMILFWLTLAGCLIGAYSLAPSFERQRSFIHSEKTSTMLFDDMTDVNGGPGLSSPIFFEQEVVSTMDTARSFMKGFGGRANVPKIFTVVADSQTNGRGTRGRKWKYGTGNLFMTIAIHRSTLSTPVHYLPLRSGTLIASAIQSYFSNSSSEVRLKWPNDILINGQKLCGILIEMEDDHFLIGIGCNIMEAPTVAPDGEEFGRPSTALVQHSSVLQQYKASLEAQPAESVEETAEGAAETLQQRSPMVHRRVAKEIAAKFEEWIESRSDTPERVIDDFSRNMDFSEQLLRDKYNKPEGRVIPLYVNDDGTLHARHVTNNEEVDLVTEYLF